MSFARWASESPHSRPLSFEPAAGSELNTRSCQPLVIQLHPTLLRPVLLNTQVAQLRVPPLVVLNKAHAGHKGFDEVDLLQRGDDQQLQVELLEQAQAILG